MTKNQIIVPLDVSSLEKAIALVEQLPQVNFWKVGLELFVSTGGDILKYLKDRNKNIFLDLKFHDIPNTVAGACRAAAKYQVDLLTIHAAGGKPALEAAVASVQEINHPPKILAITLLTSIDHRSLNFDLKIPLELPEYVLKMALLAQEAGIDGAVCSPQEVSQLRRICGQDFLLVCPGIRPSWSVSEDQKRITTPTQAIKAGADYLVIGRPITAAANPKLSWQKICQELDSI
ncbi:MAG TPA: orotidine-5'-phosphate decarboxylase [Xenococcaceae cyanobacterium]